MAHGPASASTRPRIETPRAPRGVRHVQLEKCKMGDSQRPESLPDGAPMTLLESAGNADRSHP